LLKKFILLAFLICSSVNAEEQLNLVINGISKHHHVNNASFPEGPNEKNWGLGIEYDLPKEIYSLRWVANTGFYKDSLRGTAFYLGGAGLFSVYNKDDFRLLTGVGGNLFYSARYNQSNPFVALFPVVNIGTQKYSVNLVAIPRVAQFIDAGVVFAQLKVGI